MSELQQYEQLKQSPRFQELRAFLDYCYTHGEVQLCWATHPKYYDDDPPYLPLDPGQEEEDYIAGYLGINVAALRQEIAQIRANLQTGGEQF